MYITAWILLAFFGVMSLHGLLKFFNSGLTRFHAGFWAFSVIVSALSAGYIWG